MWLKSDIVAEPIKIDKLVAFNNHPFEMHTGERQNKLADSIKGLGLLSPIIVRPIEE